MADFYTNQKGNTYCPQMRLSVSVSKNTGNTATLSWHLDYVAHGYAASTGSVGKAYSAVIDGRTVASGSFNPNGITGAVRVTQGSLTVNKNQSARNVSCKVSFAFDVTWHGVWTGTTTGSGSVGISAKTSYSVTYNANGGSGAPGKQTKWYGTNLALSSTEPTRTGYTFKGWATSASGAVAYQPGTTYTSNANLTLYAVWEAHTYAVTYDANGGTGAPAAQTKTYGTTLKLSSIKPTRTNYNFLGWGTSASSTTVAYAPGANYTANAAITLYAIWELAYIAPRLTDVVIERCESDGTLSDEGTYCKVSFHCKLDDINTFYEVSVKCVCEGSGTNTSLVDVSGVKEFDFSEKFYWNFSIESEYSVSVTVNDGIGNTTVTKRIPPFAFTMDILAGGKGVAFGKPASKEGFEVDMAAKFDQGAEFSGEASFGGAANFGGESTFQGVANFESNIYDKFSKVIGNGLVTGSSLSIDPNTTTDHIILTNHANRPASNPAYWYIMTFFYSTKSTTGNRAQIAMPYHVLTNMYFRFCYNGEWSEWKPLAALDPGTTNMSGLGRITADRLSVDTIDATVRFQGAAPVAGSIELRGKTVGGSSTPFIDFAYNGSSSDFTARLIDLGDKKVTVYWGIANVSDRRYKTNILDLDSSYLSVLEKLKPVTFYYKEDPDSLRIGFIAQDLQEIFDEMGLEEAPILSKDAYNFYTMDYNQYIPILLKGWQEHERKISELTEQVATLTKQIEDLTRG